MGAPRYEDRLLTAQPMCQDRGCPSRTNCFRHSAAGRIPRPKAQPYFSEPTRGRDEESCRLYWPVRIPGMRMPSVKRLTEDPNYTYRNDPSQVSMFLRMADIAKMLGVSKPTIIKLQKRADFPAPICLGLNIKLWSMVDVQTWLENNRARVGEGNGRHAWTKPKGEGPAWPWVHEEPHDPGG